MRAWAWFQTAPTRAITQSGLLEDNSRVIEKRTKLLAWFPEQFGNPAQQLASSSHGPRAANADAYSYQLSYLETDDSDPREERPEEVVQVQVRLSGPNEIRGTAG